MSKYWFDIETYSHGYPLYGTPPKRECPICDLGSIPLMKYFTPYITYMVEHKTPIKKSRSIRRNK